MQRWNRIQSLKKNIAALQVLVIDAWMYILVNFLNFLKYLFIVDDDEIKIELPGDLFQKIIEFFQHFNYDLGKAKVIRKPIQTSNFALLTDDWCANFFKSLTEDELGEIVMVSIDI
mgnify:FL=1